MTFGQARLGLVMGLIQRLAAGEQRHALGLRGHPNRQWEGEHACGCGAAGMACPICNTVEPPGFKGDNRLLHIPTRPKGAVRARPPTPRTQRKWVGGNVGSAPPLPILRFPASIYDFPRFLRFPVQRGRRMSLLFRAAYVRSDLRSIRPSARGWRGHGNPKRY
jgi:hypothetical protein